MKNRVLILLAVVVMLCTVCIFATAQENEPKIVDHIVYQLIPSSGQESAHYEVISLFDSEETMKGKTEITIPSQIDGIPVTAITCNKNYVDSYYNSVVESIILPDTIEVIGRDAFVLMRSLTDICLPSSVKTIDRGAFYYCSNLSQITIPENVQTIGVNCFTYCTSLRQVQVLGDELKTVGRSAFSRCEKLQSINLPASLKTIERQAFSRTALRTVRIPGNCVVEGEAFLYNNSLKKLVFEDRTNENNMFIQSYAFGYCTNLAKVYFPKESVGFQIPAAAFEGCTKLKAVYRTDHIQSIGYHAFYKCKALSSFTVPAGIKSIHKFAFSDCSGLKKMRVLTTKPAILTKTPARSAFLKKLPKDCKVFVKTEKMRQAFIDAGCTNRVIVKADLK